MEIPRLPFQMLQMDHLGPFIKSRRSYEYVLVIVYALSRYTIVAAVKSTKTKPVLDVLTKSRCISGCHKHWSQIGGPRSHQHTSNYTGIKHIKVAVLTPRANGLVERINQSVIKYLKTNTNDPKDWDVELRMLQWHLNTPVNTTTKQAPIQLVYDFPLRDLSGNKLLMVMHDEEDVEMTNKRKEAIENIETARMKWKQRFDAKHNKPVK